MGFTRMKYTPEEGLKSTSYFPDTPVSPDAAREQFQRLFDQVKTQVNALMAALENAEINYSAAHSIGCEAVSNLENGGSTVLSQLDALSNKLHDALEGDLSIGEIIRDNDIKTGMIENGAVTTEKLSDRAVTAEKLADGAITPEKIGQLQSLTFNERPDVGAGAVDSLTYDMEGFKLKLNVAGTVSTQLAPVVFGTAATPPTGTYPPGTIYVQYVA